MRAARASAARQRGFSGAFLIIAIVLIALAAVFLRGFTRSEATLKGEQGTRAALDQAAQALATFATANGYLPCPAAGNTDTGDALPATPAATCTDPAGVVPWRTMGLRREFAVDGWGRKISYRVYSGATGFTQAGGASATDCNSSLTTPLQGYLDAGGKCSTLHWNTFTQFKAGKGLTVTDKGTNKTGIAFVLISHGETGYGGYVAEGGARQQLPAAGGNEFANTGSTSPFFANAKSAPGVQPSDSTYFDDIVLFKTIDELANATQLTARAYGALAGYGPGGANTGLGVSGAGNYDRTALTAAGITPANNLGTNTITINGVQITASSGRNVSSGVGTSGEGIGAIGTGTTASANTTINSASGEFLVFLFPAVARSLGITLVDFGTSSGQFERSEILFFNGATQVGSTITKSACQSGAVQANYSIAATGNFNSVVVRPVATTGGFATTLLVGSLKACDASVTPSLCLSPTGVAANNCP